MPEAIITNINTQPGLFNVRPTITHDSSVEEPENSEFRKIGDDVLNGIKYSLTALLAAPDSEVRAGSAESEFKGVISGLSKARPELVKNAATKAKGIVEASENAKEAVFGRFGKIPANAFLKAGFDRILQDSEPIKVNSKLLGFRNDIRVPIEVLKPAPGGGLLIPGTSLVRRTGDILSANDFTNAVDSTRKEAIKSGIIDYERLNSIWGQSYEYDPFTVQAPGADFEPQAAATKLGIYIRRIKCEDETNPEWWGDDEIAIGGISTDENGDVKPIAETKLGGGWSDGKQRTWSSWQYHWFSLTEEQFWPKKYGLTFVLAEKDEGGLAAYLRTLWEKVRANVKAAIEKALEAAGTAVGGVLGSAEIGRIIGQVLGKIVAWVIDKLIGWLINLFNDDIFKPYTAWATIPSAHARWHYPNGQWGNPWSSVLGVRYYGFGGRYLLEYQWNLFS